MCKTPGVQWHTASCTDPGNTPRFTICTHAPLYGRPEAMHLFFGKPFLRKKIIEQHALEIPKGSLFWHQAQILARANSVHYSVPKHKSTQCSRPRLKPLDLPKMQG